MNIRDFKKGDVIVRVEPAKPYSPVRIGIFGMEGGVRDRSYIGEKMTLIGIANGCVYLQKDKGSFLSDKPSSLSLDVFDEGWEYYIDPMSLLNDTPEPNQSKQQLERQLSIAIENEDYERADVIKGLLKNL